jgi:hypothetical protein
VCGSGFIQLVVYKLSITIGVRLPLYATLTKIAVSLPENLECVLAAYDSYRSASPGELKPPFNTFQV